MAVVAPLGGCAGSDAPPPNLGSLLGPSSDLIEQGPARDLESAVISALSDRGWAIHEDFTLENGSRLYRLVDVHDRPGWLRVDMATQPDGRARYASTARLGRFGDAEAEKKLLERLNHHIARLREQRDAGDPD